MIPALRDYQDDMIQRTRVALRTNRTVLLQSPTGSGKTVLSAFMAGSATQKRLRVGFVCHRKELIKQTAKTYSLVGIPFGVVAAGMTGDRTKPVQICGVQTLAQRLDIVGKFDLMIWDEAHHIAAASWSRIMEHFGKAKHVGLSATPERLDGSGLGKFFSTMVTGPKVSWLIENGYLSPYRLFAPSTLDTSGMRTTAGDFNRGDLEAATMQSAVIGDAVKHYAKLAPGRRNMVFCVSVKHSLLMVDRYRAAGFRAEHIDGETDPAERDRLIAAFTAGQIQVLCSVDLVSEGFDLPAIEVATLLRKTKSVSLYLQQVGRALRPAMGKTEAILLDHVGLAAEHGLPDDDREWSLAGRRKRKKKAGEGDDEPEFPTRQCPHCYNVHRPAPTCPRCGYDYPTLGRTPEELEGELREIDRVAERRERSKELAKAQSLDDLIRLGTLRGYKNPRFWAQKVFEGRGQRAGAA